MSPRTWNWHSFSLNKRRFWSEPLVPQFIIGFVASMLLFAIWVSPAWPFRKIQLGKPAPITIKAPRTIEVIDPVRTRKLQENRARAIEPVYRYQAGTAFGSRDNQQQFFRKLASAKSREQADKILRGELPELDSLSVLQLSRLSFSRFSELSGMGDLIMRRLYAEKVREDQMAGVSRDIDSELLSQPVTPLERTFLKASIGAFLRPDWRLDQTETERLRDRARSQVAPVISTKMAGEVIVRDGELVKEEHISVLRQMGLMRRSYNALQTAALGLLSIGFVAFLFLFLYRFERKVFDRPALLVLVIIITITNSLIARLLGTSLSGYLVPLAAPGMLAALFFTPFMAATVVLFSSLATALVTGNFSFLVVGLITGLMAMRLVSKLEDRMHLVRAGLVLGATTFILAFALAINEDTILNQALSESSWGLVGGFLSAVLSIGLLPFFESAFSITTPLRLLELANPNHPLLKELMLKAPGTYQHSIVVGNLAEAAAEAVGADPLLARVGAYYHDIGKTRRPTFFIENERNQEAGHERLNPHLSFLIISAHVKEGVELAKEFKLPQEVVSIIEEHHGSSLVKFFYQRAQESEVKEIVSEDSYRYPGGPPSSKEAALVMLADCVEAAARVLKKPNFSRLEFIARRLIDERLQDGQLDESGLSLKELKGVAPAFAQVLSSVYHVRIEYPDTQQFSAADIIGVSSS